MIIIIGILIILKYMRTNTVVSYEENGDLNYIVYLKQNEYYKTKYLEKDMHYITNLIDYVYINFNYNFATGEELNYSYKYHIEADLTIFERGKPDNIIFEKNDILTETITGSDVNSKEFDISENLAIHYGEYNELVKRFRADYNIVADSNLKITLYIETNGVYEKFEYPIKVSNAMEVTIPLTEQMINIDYKTINNVYEFIIEYSGRLINNVLSYICFTFVVLFIVSIAHLYIIIYRIRKEKSFYEKKKKKILKNYERVIVEIKNILFTQKEENVIEVISFEELIDVSDKISKPVLFMEVDKNKKSIFIVKNGEEIYRYILE